MVRKGKYLPSHGGPTYLNKDNVRLKVIMWLYSQGKSNQYKMMKDSKSGIRGQKWVTLANVLDELNNWKWIEKKQSEDAANVKVFSLTEKGTNIAKAITELETNSPELWKLDSFFEVKRIE